MDSERHVDPTSVQGNTNSLDTTESKKYKKRGCFNINDITYTARGYFFTINNVDPDRPNTDEVKFYEQKYSYILYQIEEGEKSGIVHLQGMIYHNQKVKWSTLKKRFPTAHIEGIKNLEKCIQYCSKEKTRLRGPYEQGKRPQQGERNDLNLAIETFCNDKEKFIENHKNYIVKYPHGFDKLEKMNYKHRKTQPIYKEEYILEEEFNQWISFYDDYFIYDENSKWEGYKQQKHCILLTEKFINMTLLKSKAQMTVNVKYGSIPFNSMHIILINLLKK